MEHGPTFQFPLHFLSQILSSRPTRHILFLSLQCNNLNTTATEVSACEVAARWINEIRFPEGTETSSNRRELRRLRRPSSFTPTVYGDFLLEQSTAASVQ
jgi:hypothetical protein